MNLNYKPPGPVAKAFMLDNSFVRGLRGPIGSGKSGACIMEMFRRITMQEKDPADGRRKSRWAVIRNTNPQLRTTTIKSYEDWLKPEAFGDIKMAPPPFTHLITVGDLEAEVLFLALDTPDDVRKLLSLELTGAFINEAREVPKSIVDGVTSRLRRYPAMKDGGPTWSGLIMDTNAPSEDHWWPIMAGDVPPPEYMTDEDVRLLVKPDNWKFYTQPGAMLERKESGVTRYEPNPDAENVKNLDPRYYLDLMSGKTKSWVDVYVVNKLGSIADGRPVHPDFNREVHVAKEPLQPVPNMPLYAGADFGLNPSALLAQYVRGQWRILKEVIITNGGAQKLTAALNRVMADEFHGFELRVLWGDPSGDNRGQAEENTPFKVLRAGGIKARPTDSNDPEIRRAAMRAPLTRMTEGQPGLLVDPGCKTFIYGMEGGFCYKRIRTAQGESFADEPDKSLSSHIVEGGEYLMQGQGEARELIGKRKAAEASAPRNVKARTDPFARLRSGALRR